MTWWSAGHPPIKITVVGYEMKRRRFVSLHRKALRWPEASFIYVGVGLDPKDNSEAWEGEVSPLPLPSTLC